MGAQARGTARAGFTIVELSIALLAIAVMASLAIPAWFDRGEVTLDNASRLLAQDLREAQNRAAFHRQPYAVEFFEDGGGYRVVDAEGRPVPAPIGDGPFERRYSRDATFRGVVLPRVEFGDDRTLRFDHRGFAEEGGAALLRFQDDARVVRVSPYSGLIEIQGLADPWLDDGR